MEAKARDLALELLYTGERSFRFTLDNDPRLPSGKYIAVNVRIVELDDIGPNEDEAVTWAHVGT